MKVLICNNPPDNSEIFDDRNALDCIFEYRSVSTNFLNETNPPNAYPIHRKQNQARDLTGVLPAGFAARIASTKKSLR
ncbi:MAG TPA: hypothetical protein DDW24_10995 [Blastocatellia bacterium]|nr:hypothetical protein [Blastocatellia bacterium]